ncbi:MAG: helix-turn-helix domain-containing protein [Parcubacteria group bacterium]|jgi:hypothetical protein
MAKEQKKVKNFVIRDLRRKERYSIDDEYLNNYARLCGVNSTAVYNSLCRHASKNQECYPSIKLIAEQHGFGSEHTVIKAIKKLEEWGIIIVKKEKDEKTKRQKNNVYILCDRSSWNPKPTALNAPRADCISDTDPTAFDAQKPTAPNAVEGNTVNKEAHIRDIATDVADTSQISINCNIDGCKKEVESGKAFCKIHQPMNLAHFISWCAESKQKHINIIGEWAETVRPDFRTQGQWTEYIKRYSRAASSLVPFDHDQLEDGFEYIKKGITEKWLKTYTLETLLKFVTGEKAN